MNVLVPTELEIPEIYKEFDVRHCDGLLLLGLLANVKTRCVDTQRAGSKTRTDFARWFVIRKI